MLKNIISQYVKKKDKQEKLDSVLREIADAFNNTVAAVTKRIQRAKKKIKGFIQNSDCLKWMASNLEAKIFIC